MASIQLKNRHAKNLTKWLDIPLHGAVARQRARFVAFLKVKEDEIEKGRLALCEELCDKDEQGKAIMENNRYKFDPEALKKFTDEYEKSLEEPFIIDILDSNKEMLKQVKDLIINSKNQMGTAESQAYDEVCLILEATDLEATA